MGNRTPAVQHSTFVIERTYPQSRDRVFSALTTPATVRRWYVESDHKRVHRFEMDFRVGGMERAEYTHVGGTPVDGLPFVNEGRYLDIVPESRIVTAAVMSAAGHPISASLITFELLEGSAGGSRLILTHQGAFFEHADGPKLREEGWRTLLERLGAALPSQA